MITTGQSFQAKVQSGRIQRLYRFLGFGTAKNRKITVIGEIRIQNPIKRVFSITSDFWSLVQRGESGRSFKWIVPPK